jgi:hypothetical protein
MLFTLTLGLATVPFFNSLYENWSEIYVELPTVESESPIYIFPKQDLANETVLNKHELLIQDRNLSLYDFGGRSSNCGVILLTEVRKCEAVRKKARDFIWKHWQAKKRGYIECEWSGTDSGVNYQVFIEPDKNGEWHMLWIGERFGMPPNHGTFEKVIYQVKRKRATNDDYQYENGIVYLSFLDKDGEEVESW